MCTPPGIQGVQSQTIVPGISGSDNTKLSGSYLEAKTIVSKSDAIFVGKITSTGTKADISPDAPEAGPVYSGVTVRVQKILQGVVSAETSVTLFVNFGNHETLQSVGISYIFFVTKNAPGVPDPYTALKLLPASTANIDRVKALIAAAPASQ